MFDLDELFTLEYLVTKEHFSRTNEKLKEKLHELIEKRIDEIAERKENGRKIRVNAD